MNRPWTRFLPALVRNKLSEQTVPQDVISNAGWLLADNVLRMGIGFLVGIWVTRYLGPERFGQLNYAIAFVTIFSFIALLGLDGIVVRNLVRTPSRRNEILGTTFALKCAGAISTIALILSTVFLLKPADYVTHLLVSITSIGLLFQAFGSVDFFFQAEVRAKYGAYARSCAFMIAAAAKIALILSHAPLAMFALVGTGEIALGSMGLVVAYRRHGYRLRECYPSLAMAKELLRDSWPLILTEMVTMIYMRIDRIIVGEMAGNAEVGIYSVAAMITEALLFIPLSIASSIFPGIVRAQEKGPSVFDEQLQRFYNIMAFAAYCVAVPVTLFAGWGIPLLFGAEYSRAGGMVIGLAWAGLFINLGFARSYYLTTMNWTRLHFFVDLLGCAANVALNLYLVPRYGGMGAVIASIIAYWLAVHGSCFLVRPLNRMGNMLTKAMLYPKFW